MKALLGPTRTVWLREAKPLRGRGPPDVRPSSKDDGSANLITLPPHVAFRFSTSAEGGKDAEPHRAEAAEALVAFAEF